MAWINEFHYDNAGGDVGEFIEIIGRPGEDLTGYTIVLYNGNDSQSYGTASASDTINLPGGFTALRFTYPANGIQNGAPDAIALVDGSGQVVSDGGVVQFLSYEGTLTAANGPAQGLTSTDIGIVQAGSEPEGSSLHLVGTGDSYTDFSWAATAQASSGAVNNGQTLQAPVAPGEPPAYSVSVAPGSVAEGNPGDTTNVLTYTVTRSGDASAAGTVAVALDGTATVDTDYAAAGLTGGRLAFAAGETSKTFTVTATPDATIEASETVIATISAPQAADGTALGTIGTSAATGTITNDDAELVRISEIQGTAATQQTYTDQGQTYTDGSPLAGQSVTVEAVVVGDFQNGDGDQARNLNGFYLQQAGTDADAEGASRGIFVFASALGLADVNVGDVVRVTGTVSEYFGQTQLTAQANGVTVVTADAVADVNELAATLDLPSQETSQSQSGRAQVDLEAYEGMLATLPAELTITEQFQLARFNEIRLFDTNGFEQAGADGTVIEGERPFQFTQYNEPDAAANAAYQNALGNRQIVYDDGLNEQNASIDNLDGFAPYSTATAPRMGDTITGLTGIVDYQWAGNAASQATWRIRSVEDGANEFTRENGNPEPTAEDLAVEGNLKVATFNVLNFFTTLDQGGAQTDNGQDPRGANNQAEYERQLDKLVTAILSLDADIVGLIEIENDFAATGNTPPPIQVLVDALNAVAGPNAYDFVDPGQEFVGGDAIAVGAIYRPDSVRIAEGTSPSILTDEDPVAAGIIAGSNGDTSAIFNGAGSSRAPLAVTFEEIASGEELTVVVNHFKSKGSAGNAVGDADQGDGQGASNASRVYAAQALLEWLETNPTGSNTLNQMIIGDFNSYAAEDPIQLLEEGGFVDLAAEFLTGAYSYLFDGTLGTLDYALASVELFNNIADLAIAQFNADEATALDYNTDFGKDPAIFDGDTPVRSSDHDPIIAGINFGGPVEPENFTLQLLHLSDGEAGLLAPSTAPFLAALVDAFDDDYANTLILSGGDNYLPGPFSAAGTDPSLNAVIGATGTFRPDIAIHNEIGVEVSAIGNHEFDLGSNAFSDAIGASGAWEGAQFVHVSANIDFTGDPLASKVVAGGQEAASLAPGAIAPWVTVEKGGETIGILGATTQILASISSPSGATITGFEDGSAPRNDMALLASQLQPIIDEMTAQGINKIILQSHLQQIEFEQELAGLLSGVDIILAAGSNTRLGDSTDVPAAFPGHEAVFQGNYPLTATGTDGNPTLIVNTDNEYTYMGRLVAEFDQDGVLLVDSLDETINGAYASTEANVAAAWNDTDGDLSDTAFAAGTRGAEVAEITDAVNAVLLEKDGTILGYSDVYLEAERSQVRGQETNLGSLTADANAFAAAEALPASNAFVVSLKNGGGIRAPIGAVDAVTGAKLPTVANEAAGKPAGAISQLDVENALRFNNSLMVFDTTAQGLLNILDFAAGIPNNNGGFPQVGGLRYSYDEGAPSGQRIQSVALIAEDGSIVELVRDGEIVAGAPATISVTTLNFTANGGDGYPVKANGENFRFLLNDGTLSASVAETENFTANVPANVLGEQQAFAEYLTAEYGTPQTAYAVADTPEAQDLRIQNLDLREDAVFEPGEPGQPGEPGEPNPPIAGTAGDDTLQATAGDDTIDGGAGFDSVVFAGNFADYSGEDFGLYVNLDGQGSDTLTNVERLVFADGEIVLADGDPLFDSLFYMSNNPDVYASGLSAIEHYRTFGADEGRDPNALFDTSGYLAVYDDVAAAGLDALDHFRDFGGGENRDTSLNFDTRLYLQANQDVADAGVNALAHYLQFGKAEGRETFTVIGENVAADSFDPSYYLFANADVAAAGADARQHYAEFGYGEGRDASILFDTSYYLETNTDVAAAGIDPLAHYQNFGWQEGRDPSAGFDSSAYLAANDDVAAADINPLAHYLQFGIYEGRATDDVLVA